MLPAPRIILIDDNPNHLRGLSDGLNRYGVASLQVHFTGDVTGINPCPHVRVLFADLHLNEGGAAQDHVRHFTVIGGLLQETFVPTGPYALILWTRFPDQAEGLRAFLEERLQGVAKPFCVVSLDKNVHLDADGNVRDPGALVQAISQIVQGEPQIAALLNWEERVLGAAAQTVAAIIELAGTGTPAAGRGQAIGRLLFRLGVEAVGEGNVASDRFRAVNEALFPILADRISALKADADADVWEQALAGQTADAGVTIEEASTLNRFLHIADSRNVTGLDRGAVVALPGRFTGAGFQQSFGLAEATAAAEQFGCSNFAAGDAQFRWLLVQVQAACDFAQDQPGPIPYVLALEMPVASVSKKPAPGAVIKSPAFTGATGQPKLLHINARFQTSVPEGEAGGVTVEYRLREPLLSDIAYRIHTYGARPGIISFHEKKAKPAVGSAAVNAEAPKGTASKPGAKPT